MIKNSNFVWIDNLRAISCIMVIILHVTGHWLTKLQGVELSVWSSIAIVHTLTRFCVPVFIMITGALLLTRNTTIVDFYKLRITRILKPFLFWTFFYVLISLLFKAYNGQIQSLFEVASYIINALFIGASYHFWYLYLLFVLYLTLPFIILANNKLSRLQLSLIVFSWLLILILVQFVQSPAWLKYPKILIGYAGYLVVGYYLSELKLNRKVAILIAVLFILSGWLFTYLPVYKSYISSGIVLAKWFYFLNINVACLAIGVFLLIKNISISSSFLLNISKHSFGIYFIHLFYLMLLNKINVIGSVPLLLYILINVITILGLSYFSIKALLKVPIIGKYIE